MANFKIVMADDDEEDFILIKEAFESKKLSHDLKHLRNGLELIEYLSEKSDVNSKPDLILLDINMPKLNGYETLNAIRKKLRSVIPVFMYSTSCDGVEKSKCFDLGADAFITKGATFDKLLIFAQNIDDYLNRRRTQLQLIQLRPQKVDS